MTKRYSLSEHSYKLGSINHEGETKEDVVHRIAVGGIKWKYAYGMLCDPQALLKLKGNFYKMPRRSHALWRRKLCNEETTHT